MLGNLFDDEDEGGSSSSRVNGKASSTDIAPRFDPDDFTSTKLVGISNQGATCYLNSLIQTLFFTPELRGK